MDLMDAAARLPARMGLASSPADYENIWAMTTVERINGKPAAEFWTEIDAERGK